MIYRQIDSLIPCDKEASIYLRTKKWELNHMRLSVQTRFKTVPFMYETPKLLSFWI